MLKEEIIKSLNEILESEKWSKFQLSEYNVKKFKNVDEFIGNIKEKEVIEDIINYVQEHLKKNELNLVARYILAILSYGRDINEFYINFEKVINSLKERAKWSIVEYLSRRMLDFEKNEFAFKSLIEALRNLNKTSETIEVQKQLLEFNPEDTDTCLALASFYEQQKDKEKAIYYYRIALRVFITKKNKKMVEDIWLRLIDLIDKDDIDLLLDLETGLKLNFEPDFVSLLLSFLLPVSLNKQDYDKAITILKKMLIYSPKNREYRDKLIEVYSLKYKNHTKLDEFLKSSGLKMWWKDVHKSIEIFEKQIKFDVGTYVYHHSFGTGKVIEIDKDNIKIDFKENPEHIMSFDMAIDTLTILPENHIKVLKRYQNDEMKKIALEEPIKFIELVVKSYNNEVDIDILKSEVTSDDIIPAAEWIKWWNIARKELRISSNFKFIENEKKIKYIETEGSYGEIIKNSFDSADDFFEKIKVVYQLIENDVHRKVDISIYQHITNWFIEKLKKEISNNPAYSYISLIVINKLCHSNKEISRMDLKIDEKEILNSVSSIPQLFKQMDVLEYQKILLNDIAKYREDWQSILYEIMLLENSKIFDHIYEIFLNRGVTEKIIEIIDKAVEKYRDYPELFFWCAKNILTDNFKNLLGEKLEDYKSKVLESLFFLLSYLQRLIKDGINVEENEKLQKNIIRLLFDKSSNIFVNYIKNALMANKDVTTLLQLFKESEYIPKKQRENVIAEIRSLEKPIVI